jgi:UDP-N-acetylglucosamine--N-acetylmuramyl-(pentapeptide) pyrophosphoryl-undecaprenol N-acetylglucosamine transferase
MGSISTPLRIIIAGGGTGGHIFPAEAVLQELAQRNIPVEALWIGQKGGREEEVATSHGIPFDTIQVGKARQTGDLRDRVLNVVDKGRVLIGIPQAWLKVRSFRPHVIFATGGYVCMPTALAGASFAPVLVHEQTVQIGSANRLASRRASTLAVSWDQAIEDARIKGIACRVVNTGNPVRASLSQGNAARGFAAFGLDPHLPLLYVTGGAKGSVPVNKLISDFLPTLLEHMQIIHQTGRSAENHDADRLETLRASLPQHLQKRYVVRDFIRDELPDVFAASALVVGRAGAGTITELATLGKPSVLIPLVPTSGNEQVRNATMLAEAGAALSIEQASTTSAALAEQINALITDQPQLEAMAAAAQSIANANGTANLTDELLALAGR